MNPPTLLDGAMGSALRARGVTVPDHQTSIWSALALIEAPDQVTSLHRAYIRAGADVVTTNNYAVTPVSLAREGMSSRLDELILTACELAQCAVVLEGSRAEIAGSLPPLNISYRPDLVGPFEQNLSAYRSLTRLMAPHVDLFICETMTTATEARAAAQAALETDRPVWVCWTMSDDPIKLRGGEAPTEAVTLLSDLPIAAFLLNCCSVYAVSEALPKLRACTNLPTGAYANPFLRESDDKNYAIDTPNWLGPDAYAIVARQWIAAGADIVGGCCGTDPEYTSALDRMLKPLRQSSDRVRYRGQNDR